MEVDTGLKELVKLVDKFGDGEGRNEAQTRFSIIDSLIIGCLGWPKEMIEVERHGGDGGFTDYELGRPRSVIWEAKKEGVAFELPVGAIKSRRQSIPALCMISSQVKDAIEQAQVYCARRGVQIAVVTNGHQLIAYLATRTDGIDPLTGKALVFGSLEDLRDNFALAWQMLSFDGIQERKIVRYLSSGQVSVPTKLSATVNGYPKARIPSELQANLRQLSELLIQDIVESQEIEELFLRNCYSESGALSHYALLSKTILDARYSAMFSQAESAPKVMPAVKGKKAGIDPELMSEAMAKRPIVLIGDVGVGKTSFVKHLIYVDAKEEMKNSLYIYIDLGSKASLAKSLKDYALNEIESQLLDRYKVDIQEFSFLKGTYASEISRFSTGLWGLKKESEPDLFQSKLIEMLQEKIVNKDEHLKKSFFHLSHARRQQVVIFLDNADQRDFDTQQEAFIISQELAKDWNAFVFVSVRPQTFYKSKRSGALTAYPHKVFTISPPRIDHVVERRLQFALDMAEGKLPIELYEYVKLNSRSLTIFLKVLIRSLSDNKDLNEFLVNITGGNVRAAVELVTGFIGNPGVDAEKIIKEIEEGRGYLIPLHEFIKVALLGDFCYHSADTSIVFNLFDVSTPDQNEHFLCSMILAYLSMGGSHKDKDGFCAVSLLMVEMQNASFNQHQVESALRRLTNKKLIEASQRVTFEEDESGLIGEMPDAFRVTSVGAYHLLKWVSDFAYMDAMMVDTPIFDAEVRTQIISRLESSRIEDRYRRTVAFREYLSRCWAAYTAAPSYFNFEDCVAQGDASFESVKRFLIRNRPDFS